MKIEPDFVTKTFMSDDFRKFRSKSYRYPIYANPRKQIIRYTDCLNKVFIRRRLRNLLDVLVFYLFRPPDIALHIYHTVFVITCFGFIYCRDQKQRQSACRKKSSFYPNVTTLRSGLCYRNSVCLSSVVCLSVCLSVTLVHPTQGVEPFGNISSPLCTLAIL